MASREREGRLPERRSLLNSNVATSLAAGAVAGAVAKTTIAPLDRTKINFQISNRRFSLKDAARFVYDTGRNEGVRSLWRGNSATMVRVIPFAAIQFQAHEYFTARLRPPQWTERTLPPGRRLLAGSLAGVTATTFTYPLDMVRARMAVRPEHAPRGLHHAFFDVVSTRGPWALWRGLAPTLLGVVPYAGISFFTYGSLKKLYWDRYGSEMSVLPRLASGALAGLLGQTSSYPLDIVRRRMQTEGMVNLIRYHGIVWTMQFVAKKEGVRGLFKGVTMNWIKGPIAVTVSFNTYDYVLRFLRRDYT